MAAAAAAALTAPPAFALDNTAAPVHEAAAVGLKAAAHAVYVNPLEAGDIHSIDYNKLYPGLFKPTTGVDFIATKGTPVHAVTDGEIVHSAWDPRFGHQVVIRQADGHYSQYGRLLSERLVKVGEKLVAGQTVGFVGASGIDFAQGPGLHFEIRTGENPDSHIDPVPYMAEHGVVI
ncbi:M23 family metallopeptidase [Streptomyces vinaceus]|uniref:M23 family metallopeptidase n=1 Tax=Streptomyces vinaceus TaxID=1960 RepID=UPI0035DF0248